MHLMCAIPPKQKRREKVNEVWLTDGTKEHICWVCDVIFCSYLKALVQLSQEENKQAKVKRELALV